MQPKASAPWAAFQYRIFTIVWVATVLSNIGTWMYNAAAGWLMTNLTSDALIVSLVQVANALPMFMFAILAGVLSDIIDKRRFLIAGEVSIAILSAIFAAMVWFGRVTPASLLWFTFLIGVANALTSPAWQAVVPELVPWEALPAAVAANSAGVNVSRAIGPALAGAIIAPLGIAAPFVVNAVSNLGSIGALISWREPKRTTSSLPVEPLRNAIRNGFRYAANSPSLRGTLLRTLAFFLFASTYWALLPLVARSRISGGPEMYGILLGAIGVGAVTGAFGMPSWKMRLGPDRLVGAASVGTAIALVLYGLAREPVTALLASLIAGVSWIAAIATINVSAQVSLPDWVRGRGLAIYMTVLFGSMTVGSLIWGKVASLTGLPMAHFVAAGGALLAIPLTWRWKLQTAGKLDLTPSMQWPAPIVSQEVKGDPGPVLVTIEYRIAKDANRSAFLAALDRLRRERLRDGAYTWGIFEDTAERGRFLETFLVESWLEHLRQHERVTNTDAGVQQSINGLLKGEPTVTHFIAPSP
jgi:MFS family permease